MTDPLHFFAHLDSEPPYDWATTRSSYAAERIEAEALTALMDDPPPLDLPSCTADGVARIVRSALRANGMLGTCPNDRLPMVKHTRDRLERPGWVTVIPHGSASFTQLAGLIRAYVSPQLLAARNVSIEAVEHDLMDDFRSTCNVRVWPHDRTILRHAVLTGELMPTLLGENPHTRAWRSVSGYLPAHWSDLADAMAGSKNRSMLLGLAYRSLVSQLDQLPLDQLPRIGSRVVALASDWVSEWSELFGVALTISDLANPTP